MTSNEHLAGAWLGLIHWASCRQELWQRFEAETGLKWSSAQATTVLEALIDKAAGLQDERDKVLLRFVIWVTQRYWGEDEAPALYFKLRAAWEKQIK